MIQPLFVFSDWGILILRVILGLVLIFHGWPKLKHLPETATSFGGMGFRPGILWATIAVIVELGGGAFLIAGFLTQLAALLAAIQFAAIIVKLKFKQGLVGGYELDLLIFGAAVILTTLSGGSLSLDNFLGIWLY